MIGQLTKLFLVPTLGAALLGAPGLHGQSTSGPQLSVVLDEARAAVHILELRDAGRVPTWQDWERIWQSEGFLRLVERQEAMGRGGTREGIEAYLMDDATLARLSEFRAGVARWESVSAEEAGAMASAYLSPGTRLEAKVYPVIKHTSNSFVFDLTNDPAIFFTIGTFTDADELTNVMAHELHHVGSARCAEPTGLGDLAPSARRVVSWLSAFGEGMAMLAAAGGPAAHPHHASTSAAWLVWERDIAHAESDLTEVIRFFEGILHGTIPEDEQRDRLFRFISRDGVPQGAFYTVGWKMAAAVERAFGRQRIIESVCDPRILIASYNAVVRSVDSPSERQLVLWPDELLGAIGAPRLDGTQPR